MEGAPRPRRAALSLRLGLQEQPLDCSVQEVEVLGAAGGLSQGHPCSRPEDAPARPTGSRGLAPHPCPCLLTWTAV